jgi:hypothetical protein
MRSPVWLLAAPIGIPTAAYVFVGEFWIAAGIAAVVAIVTLGMLALHYREDRDRLDLLLTELSDEHAACAPVRHLTVVPPIADDDWFARLYDEKGELR